MIIFFVSCVLFYDGYIPWTCDELNVCDPVEQHKDSAVVDTQEEEFDTAEEEEVIYTFFPNRVSYFVELAVIDGAVSSHSAWENKLSLLIYEYADQEGYPSSSLPGCWLILRSDNWMPIEPNAQAWYGVSPQEVSVESSGRCNDMNPEQFQLWFDAAQNASWEISFGKLTDAQRNEYRTWQEYSFGEVQDELFDQSATFYVKSDWLGNSVTLAPSLLKAYAPNVAGAPNINEQVIFEGVDYAPSGFYNTIPFFSYQLIAIQ